MPQADEPSKWSDENVDRLVGWMEDHRDDLVQPALWSKACKQDLFRDDDQLSVERIKNKGLNMKRQYLKVRSQFQDKTGFGVTEEDCEQTIKGMQSHPLVLVSF